MTDVVLIQLQERITALEERLALYEINGLADSFSGSGNQVYGGGTMRIGPNGIEIRANTPGQSPVGIWYVPTFQAQQPGSNTNYSAVRGNGNSGGNIIELVSERANGDYAGVFTYSDVNNNLVKMYTVKGGAPSVDMGVSSHDTPPHAFVESGPLRLDARASDYPTPLEGGIGYRYDTKRLTFHVNSITRNLTMDGTNTTLTIAAGVVTITTSFHAIDTEAAAATDDLDTISGGQTGQVLHIHAANSARDVVAKDGTGNLKLAGDFTMNNAEDTLTLVFDGTNWLELARSDNGA